MGIDLSTSETRVLGALLEKQLTTPDAYPLTLNGLRLACNQSTNRDPVVSYDDAIIRDALHRLERRGFTRLASGAGSRSPKYRHLLAERLPMSEAERAILCVLMLRGRQTPGELKQRTERMHPFADLQALQETLDRLTERDLATRLGRRPGQKEERYLQLLTDPEADSERPVPAVEASSPNAGVPFSRVGMPSSQVGVHSSQVGLPSSQVPSPDEQEASALQVGPLLSELQRRIELLEDEVADLRRALDSGRVGEPA